MRARRALPILGWTLGLGLLAAFAVQQWLRPPYQHSEILFHGGPIVTVSDAGTVEALLVRDGRIVALGDEASVRAEASDGAEDFNLAGNTLLPGLIEPHTHPIASAMLGAAIDVSGFRYDSRAALMAGLREDIKGWRGGDWVLAFGWDPVMIDDLEPPTLAELDALSPDRPLFILTQMMHDAYMNSAALKAAGIGADTPDPTGGQFVRDADGNLTGTIREVSALNVAFAAMPPPPKGSADLLLNLQLGAYARAGYTTIAAMGALGRVNEPIGLIKRRISDPDAPVQALIYAIAPLIAPDRIPDLRDGAAPLVGVKFWIDGSPYAGGAALAKPYADTPLTHDRLHLPPGHRGELSVDPATFEAAFRDYNHRGFQIAVHVQGERAIETVLETAERVFADEPHTEARYRLEHDALITESQLARARALGFTTSFFIDHIYFYGDKLPALVGTERTARYMPLRSALEAGHHISLHGDHPATPIDPMRSFISAVSRQTRRGDGTVAPDQAISRLDALKALTIGPAWQLGLEETRGSLEIGKAADLVVMRENPLSAELEALRQNEVLDTWIAGRQVDNRVTTRANAALLWQMLTAAF